MEKKYESTLQFEKYVVDMVEFKNNENFIQKGEQITIDFDISRETKKDDNTMQIQLTTIVFKDSRENNYPFEMNIIITGYFNILENEENYNLEPNAIAILYPYVRAIVSTYTANANIAPLILPAINVNKMIEEQDKGKRD